MTESRPREMTGRLVSALRSLPVVVMSGLRQAGKSTLLQREPSVAKGRSYRTLGDFATLAAAKSQPEGLLESAAVLDEVQRCPELSIRVHVRTCVEAFIA